MRESGCGEKQGRTSREKYQRILSSIGFLWRWKYPGSRVGNRIRCIFGCPIVILSLYCVFATSIFFYDRGIYSRSDGDDPSSSYRKQNVDWRERMALQMMKSTLSKEVINVIVASTADMGPFSLDAFRKCNLSESWKVNEVDDSSKNSFSFEVSQTSLDVDQKTLHQLADASKEPYKRETKTVQHIQLRREKREALSNHLVHSDPETIRELEDAASKRSLNLDPAILEHYTIREKEIENRNSDSLIRLMRDQIIMARVYVSIAKIKNQPGLQKELEVRITESQQALGEAVADADLDKR